MLSTLLKLLKPAKKMRPITTGRPLKMEMVYGRQHPPSANGKLPLSNKERLLQQKNELLQRDIYQHARIEPHRLDLDQSFIGLNKHRLIHHGVFMYPESVQESPAWSELINQALVEETGIASFKLKQSCDCLKISYDNHSFEMLYLIGKDYLTRVDWVLRPDEIADIFAR